MISGLFKKFLKVAWFLPGFLLWASFPPMGEKIDVAFALAPLLWLSRRVDAKTSAMRWFMSGIFFWIATLSWMPAIVKNGGPWPLVVLGWFALAAYCAAYFAGYGYLIAKAWAWARQGSYGRRLLTIVLFEPILWCGLELVRSRFLGGFAWNQLGVVPVNGGFGAPAALGGVYLCSALVILINGTIAGIAERMWKPETSGFPQIRKFGPLETLLVFALVYGVYQLAVGCRQPTAIDGSRGERSVKVALVQRNFPCVFQGRDRQDPYEVYGKLLENVAMLKPDLVVMAESAMCEFGPVDQQGAVRFAKWASEKCGGASVLAGGTRFGDNLEFNSAGLYSFATAAASCFESNRVQSTAIELYDKVHLVPFGEFIPGDKWITALQKLAPVGSCTPGELKLLTLGDGGLETADVRHGLPLGVAICFEDTDSAQMRQLAKMGARVLFFITNDSWFSHSNESVQHAWQATARAIETGLPVVRVGNSGVTGTISPDGKATWLVGANGKPLVDRSGTMFDRIKVKERGEGEQWNADFHCSPSPSCFTFYTRFGDWPLGVAFALLILAMILVKYKAHHEKRRSLSL